MSLSLSASAVARPGAFTAVASPCASLRLRRRHGPSGQFSHCLTGTGSAQQVLPVGPSRTRTHTYGWSQGLTQSDRRLSECRSASDSVTATTVAPLHGSATADSDRHGHGLRAVHGSLLQLVDRDSDSLAAEVVSAGWHGTDTPLPDPVPQCQWHCRGRGTVSVTDSYGLHHGYSPVGTIAGPAHSCTLTGRLPVTAGWHRRRGVGGDSRRTHWRGRRGSPP